MIRSKFKLILIVVSVLQLFAVAYVTMSVNIKFLHMFGVYYLSLIISFILIFKVFVLREEVDFIPEKISKWYALFFTLLTFIVFFVGDTEIGVNIHNTPFLFLVLLISVYLIDVYVIVNSVIVFLLKNDYSVYSISPNAVKKTVAFLFLFHLLISFIIFLIFYPGIITTDSANQMNQAMGYVELMNHHPIFMTMILKVLMKCGILLNLSSDGIGLYVIAQIVINSAIYTGATMLLLYKKCSKFMINIFVAFIFLNPVIYMYNITVWKDIQLGVTFLLLIILFAEFIFEPNIFLKNKKLVVFTWLLCLAFSLWKNNAIYVLLLTIPWIPIFMKKSRIILIAFISSVIVAGLFITGPVYKHYSANEINVREKFSIPFQQIGRVLKNEGNISEADTATLSKYIDVESAAENYKYYLSDPIKDTMNQEEYKKNPTLFLQVWLKVVKDNPKITFSATVMQTYRYWTLPNNYWIAGYSADSRNQYEGSELSQSSIIGGKSFAAKWEMLRKIPIISDIWSIGLFLWIHLILIYIYFKKFGKEKVILLVPPFAFWLTIFASPVNGEYRYAFPFILTVLFLLVYATKVKRIE